MSAVLAPMSGRLRATPLHQVDPVVEGRWRATGEDPQFLLQLDQPLVARGIFCLTARVRGDHSIAPVLYLDLGEGWCEATRHAMEAAGDGRWSLLVALPAGFRQARFDPSEAAVEFELGDVTVEQIPASRLVLEMLAGEVALQPERGAELLREVAARWHPDDAHEAGLWLLARGTDVLRRAPDAYRDWITAYDTLQPAMSRTLRAAVAAMPRRPRVLLASPLAGTGRLLDALLAGVRAQLYPDWDLALLADPDTSPALLAQARATTEGDSRVRVEAADLGALLAGSEAAYVLVLAPGQVLRPHALLALVDAMLARPSAGVGYWDSDRLDGADRRSEPNFRPDWNPDLFLAQGYFDGAAMLSMACARAAMEDGVAFADAGAEASRWLLRALASGGDVPVHVPMVLSHAPIESPPAVAPEARAALVEEALARADVQARIEARPDGLRIHWPLPEPAPMVSLVIPTRDRVDLLRQCVDSILASTDYPDYEILVVDNQSREAATLAYLRELESEPRVRVLVDDGPFNYSRINNAAIAQARGSLVALVNNDIEVIDGGWLREMVSQALRPGVGIVGAMLYYPDDTIQHAGVLVGLGGVAGHVYSRHPRGTRGSHGRAALAQDLSAVTGACLLTSRALYAELGGLDERLAVAFNDVDFCLRARASGYRVVWTPFAELYHHESATRGLEDTAEKRARFEEEVRRMRATWGDRLEADPAYNPNLSLGHGAAMELAEPPRQALAAWVADLRARTTPSEGSRKDMRSSNARA